MLRSLQMGVLPAARLPFIAWGICVLRASSEGQDGDCCREQNSGALQVSGASNGQSSAGLAAAGHTPLLHLLQVCNTCHACQTHCAKFKPKKYQCEPLWTIDVQSLEEDEKARASAASTGLQGDSAGCKQHGRFLTPVRCYCRAALHWPIDLFDVRRFDSQLGQSLEMLAASHRAWQGSAGAAPEVLVDGQPIKDLCLTFVLPGDVPGLMPWTLLVLVSLLSMVSPS